MNYSGDVVEQVVRMSLETGGVAARLVGSGAKQLVILIYAILREQKETTDKVRLINMLRSGKELKVFAVKDSDFRLFCREVKKYGILCCILKDRDVTDGLTDIMARAEDAGKINRIIERSDLATVDMAQVKQEIEQSRVERRADAPETPAAEPTAGMGTPQGPMTERKMDGSPDTMLAPALEGGAAAPGRVQPDRDVDEFLKVVRGASSGRKEDRTENLTMGRTEKFRPSVPTSKPKEADNPGISDPLERPRPSVRQALKEIWAEQKQRVEEKARENAGRQKPIQHKASPKKKVRKQKERQCMPNYDDLFIGQPTQQEGKPFGKMI